MACSFPALGPHAPARAVVLGRYRDTLGSCGDGLEHALGAVADVRRVDARAALRSWPRAYRDGASLIRRDGFELVHVLDPRLAPVGAMLRRRCRVPATITLTADALRRRGPRAALERRSFSAFDEAFVPDDAMPVLEERARLGVAVYAMPAAARELPMPSSRDVARVLGALRGLDPDQALVGVPWPRNAADFRWFRDIVMPSLDARPAFLLFGVTRRRELRAMLRFAAIEEDVRVVTGAITASLVAAAARVVDAFAVPAAARVVGAPPGDLFTALTVSGVPVVTDDALFDCVPAYGSSGLLVDAGDERGFVAALDGLLRLPHVQRLYLGEEVARSILRERPWRPVAEAYAERFSALVGRPLVPAMLRAA